MVSPIARTIATEFGHVLAFEAGVPQHVPPRLVSSVMEKGVVPADETAAVEVQKVVEEPEGVKAPTDPDERILLIAEAMKTLEATGKLDFTAGNKPAPGKLTKTLGWEVHANERDAAWALIEASKAE
ncbi:hypothetical protein [Caldimonas sp. KR1-144]|uniref:hypothetical protein n=1 Tax=Caldimonas sp. KR1-144 TaxID=3400911 RepID=UPI003C302CBB